MLRLGEGAADGEGGDRAYNRKQCDAVSHRLCLGKREHTTVPSRITCGIGELAGPPALGRTDRWALRKELLARRRALPAPWRHEADGTIGQHLMAWLAGRRPSVLALWWPLPAEPDLTGVFEPLSRAGWTVALPRAVAADRALEFGRWYPGANLVEHRHRVLVPEPFEAVEPSLLVAPCLGFDVRGWRLGYGGGYYDRTLSALGIEAAGVGYDVCEVSLVPESHDRRLATLLTESRVLTCGD